MFDIYVHVQVEKSGRIHRNLGRLMQEWLHQLVSFNV
jgi:hypothetical protein